MKKFVLKLLMGFKPLTENKKLWYFFLFGTTFIWFWLFKTLYLTVVNDYFLFNLGETGSSRGTARYTAAEYKEKSSS